MSNYHKLQGVHEYYRLNERLIVDWTILNRLIRICAGHLELSTCCYLYKGKKTIYPQVRFRMVNQIRFKEAILNHSKISSREYYKRAVSENMSLDMIRTDLHTLIEQAKREYLSNIRLDSKISKGVTKAIDQAVANGELGIEVAKGVLDTCTTILDYIPVPISPVISAALKTFADTTESYARHGGKRALGTFAVSATTNIILTLIHSKVKSGHTTGLTAGQEKSAIFVVQAVFEGGKSAVMGDDFKSYSTKIILDGMGAPPELKMLINTLMNEGIFPKKHKIPIYRHLPGETEFNALYGMVGNAVSTKSVYK